MTAPSFYRQEMAKRNIAIPKATGCPRVRALRTAPQPVRKPTGPRAAQRAKWPVYASLYTDEQMSLQEIAEQFGVTFQSVQYALSKMGVPMRSKGNEMKLERALRKIEQLERDNMILRNRLSGLRTRMRNQEAA